MDSDLRAIKIGGRHGYTHWMCTLKCGSRLDYDDAGNGLFVNHKGSRMEVWCLLRSDRVFSPGIGLRLFGWAAN